MCKYPLTVDTAHPHVGSDGDEKMPTLRSEVITWISRLSHWDMPCCFWLSWSCVFLCFLAYSFSKALRCCLKQAAVSWTIEAMGKNCLTIFEFRKRITFTNVTTLWLSSGIYKTFYHLSFLSLVLSLIKWRSLSCSPNISSASTTYGVFCWILQTVESLIMF